MLGRYQGKSGRGEARDLVALDPASVGLTGPTARYLCEATRAVEQIMTDDHHVISPSQPSSALRISETILKTGQLDAMKPWYKTVLGVEPFFEHAPALGGKPLDLGGQTRASDLRMCFFRLGLDYPYVQTVGIFEEPGTALAAQKGACGLHHMQLMTSGLDELCAKFEALRDHGMRPHRSADHGVMTSFYYRDPDGNNVEITAQNHPTLEAMVAFMASPEFKANPSGSEIENPDAFVAAHRQARTPALADA